MEMKITPEILRKKRNQKNHKNVTQKETFEVRRTAISIKQYSVSSLNCYDDPGAIPSQTVCFEETAETKNHHPALVKSLFSESTSHFERNLNNVSFLLMLMIAWSGSWNEDDSDDDSDSDVFFIVASRKQYYYANNVKS